MNGPGAWSDDVNAPGPIAAVGVAQRMIPVGINEEREDLGYFATSALDGSSAWLELPGFDQDRAGLEHVALSPDGRWLGWVRAGRRSLIEGWSVLDTTTGEIRQLQVEGHDRVRSAGADLAFSGDSRHLLTSFETTDQPKRGDRGHQFVAWNVEDGTPTVLEEPGFYWLPSLGHADEGVVWSRKRDVFRHDPRTGRRRAVTLPRDVLMASWAPDDAAFAYIGRDDRVKGERWPDERLYVGATPSTADRVIDLPETSPIGESLTWSDPTHVVVGNYRRAMYVVDITDGSFETIDMAGAGDQWNTPHLATDLWSKPLRAPVDPTRTNDPRRPWRWAGLCLFVALLGGGASLLRRADRSGTSPAPHVPSDHQGES